MKQLKFNFDSFNIRGATVDTSMVAKQLKQLKKNFNEFEVINKWAERIIAAHWCGISKERIAELTKLPLYTIEKMIEEHIKRIK
jgi:hypothetical protein